MKRSTVVLKGVAIISIPTPYHPFPALGVGPEPNTNTMLYNWPYELSADSLIIYEGGPIEFERQP